MAFQTNAFQPMPAFQMVDADVEVTIGATETPDVASFAVTVSGLQTALVTIAATETPDTAAFAVDVFGIGVIEIEFAVIESSDTMFISVGIPDEPLPSQEGASVVISEIPAIRAGTVSIEGR